MTRYTVLTALCVVAAIAYFSRNILGIASADGGILRDLHLSERQMAIVMGSFFFTYSGMQIPGGAMGDRWGSRRVLAVLALVWALATAAMGAAAGFYSLLTLYLMIGIAQGGLFPCCTITFSHWIPTSRRAGCWLVDELHVHRRRHRYGTHRFDA